MPSVPLQGAVGEMQRSNNAQVNINHVAYSRKSHSLCGFSEAYKTGDDSHGNVMSQILEKRKIMHDLYSNSLTLYSTRQFVSPRAAPRTGPGLVPFMYNYYDSQLLSLNIVFAGDRIPDGTWSCRFKT
jgi:hypothetical protein